MSSFHSAGREGAMDSDRSEGDLMSRRTVIGAAAATVVSTSAAAQQAVPRPKGPRVWLDMDQKELDDAYDQSVYAPNRDQLNQRRASESELVRARLGAARRVAYGTTPHEMIDIYPTAKENAPIAVFVHGGACAGGVGRNAQLAREGLARARARCAFGPS